MKIVRVAVVQPDWHLRSLGWVGWWEMRINSFILQIKYYTSYILLCCWKMKMDWFFTFQTETRQWVQVRQIIGCHNNRENNRTKAGRWWRWNKKKWTYLRKSLWLWVAKARENSIKRCFLWFRPQYGWWSHLLRLGTLLKERCGQKGSWMRSILAQCLSL